MSQSKNQDNDLRPYTFSVALRIHHPEISPDAISKALGCPPMHSWRAGDAKPSPGKGIYSETYWIASVAEGHAEDLSSALGRLVDGYQSKKDVFHELRRSGGNVEFFIGWFFNQNSGDVLGFDLLSKLAELKIDLAFDVYNSADE